MRLSPLVAAILHIASNSLYAAASGAIDSRQSPVVVKTIHHFNSSIGITDFAVRHTGEILASIETEPALYLIEPKVNGSATPIFTFEGYQVVHSIVEVALDQFYVTCENLSLVTHIDVPGSPSVFHIDMSQYPEHIGVDEVAHFPEGRLLNGMGVLSVEKGLVYLTDERLGVINLLNVYTGEYFVAINNSLTNAPPNSSEITSSVHSVHVVDVDDLKYLYFSNFAQGLIARVLINPETGLAIGEPEIVKSNLTLVANFVLDKDLNIFTVLFGENQILRIDGKTGEVLILAEGNEYFGPSSVGFGRLETDKGDLYTSIDGQRLPDGVGGALFRLELGDLAVV